MDGAMLFSDADLKDRAQRHDRAEKNRTERFKRTNTVKPLYEGAPNLVDPIIDDLIRELKLPLMWAFMSRTARANAGKCGLIQAAGKVLPPEAWAAEYCVSAGVSGRSVNQIRTLTSLTNMGQLAPIVENMTETLGAPAVKDFYLWIFNTLDTELARRVMGSANKGEGS